METQKYDYFVAHKFSKKERDDLRNAIEEAFKESGLKGYYADEEVRQGHILEKIKEMIFTTQFGIYDVTDGNPNVCLELGIAMGQRKPYYIIVEKRSRLPADLQGLDRIEYESYKQLTEELKKKVVERELDRRRTELDRRRKMDEIIKKEKEYLEEIKITEEELLKKHCKLYKAEKMLHRFGCEVDDNDALNGKAWFADLSELSHHIVYGPYEPLPELGEYVAFFKMKIDDNSSLNPMFILDVTRGGFASALVRGVHFHKPNKYQLFGLKFKYQNFAPTEYRVYNVAQKGKVWIDYVAIMKLHRENVGDTNYESK